MSATRELPGTAERARRGPVRHKGRGPAATGWVDPRGRATGGRSFALHRITGIALVIYLYVHLGVLSMLLIGASTWGDFLSVVKAKEFLVFDVVLLAGLLFHALNGIRVALVGSGFVVRRQKALFWAAMAFGAPALIYGAIHFLGGA
jgi:succinate dehydrogenase / fumarate reductase cytochrome b subunit